MRDVHEVQSSEDDATAPSGTGHMRVLVCAVLAQLMIVMDMTIVSVALPSMQDSLGFSDQDRQWIITGYTLAFGGLVLFGGKLTQVLGARRSYWLGIAGFSLASLAGGLAPSLAALLAARAVQGVFAALLAPTNLSMVSTTFTEPKIRAKVFAALGSTGGAGAAVGMVLGGVLTEYLDWRWCLFVNIPVAAVAAAVSARALDSMKRGTSQRLFGDVPGLVLGCGGVLSIVYGFSEASRTDWTSRSTITWLVVGAAGIVAFLVREAFASDPMLPLKMVSNPARAAAYAVIAMGGWVQMGCILYLTYFFQHQLGYSALETGISFLPMIVALIIAAIAANRALVPRFGIRTVFPLGLSVQAAGFVMLSGISVSSTYTGLVGGMMVGGFGLGLTFGPAMSAGSQGVPADHNGLVNAVLTTSQQIGASFGVALLSTYATHHATDQLRDQATTIRQEIVQALAGVHADPSSAQGKRISAAIIDAYANAAEASAFGAGFTILGISTAVAAGALILAGVLLAIQRAKRHTPDSLGIAR